MFVVPIWLNNLVWFASFMMAVLQLRVKSPRHPVLNLHFIVMVVSVIAMLAGTLVDYHKVWVKFGLFAAGIGADVYMYRLFRYMPSKPER